MEPSKAQSHLLKAEIATKFMCCYLCHGDFMEPKLLPCGHTFCFGCLQNKFQSEEDEAPLCPACKATIDIPTDGFQGFPLNVSIHTLQSQTKPSVDTSKCIVCQYSGKDVEATHVCGTCEDPLCADCSKAHPKSSQTHDHVVITLQTYKEKHRDGHSETSLKEKLFCWQHQDQELCFYCKTCSLPICSKCTVVESHSGHFCKDLSTMVKEVKGTLEKPLKEIDLAHHCFATNVSKLRAMKYDLNRQCDFAAKEITKRAEEICALIREIEKETLSNMENIRHEGNKEINELIAGNEDKVVELHEAKFDSNSILKNHDVQILSVHKAVHQYLAKTAAEVKRIRQSPGIAKWTEVLFQGPSIGEIQDVLKLSFGSVLQTKSDCHRLTEFELEDPVNSLTVMNDHIITCSRDSNSLKIYTENGELYDEFENHGMRPCDIASLGNELYVADEDSDQIRVYSRETGKYIHKGQMKLANDGITKGHKHVSLDPFGRVFVSYEEGRKVNVYNKKKQLCAVVSRERFHPAVYAGLHLATFGLYSLFQYNKSGDLLSPKKISVARDGTLYVASHQPAGIQAITSTGDKLFSFKAVFPAGVNVDLFQNVVVAEGGIGGTLHLVSSSGNKLHNFILKGNGVAINATTFDADGNLVVAYHDSTGSKLLISSYVYTTDFLDRET